MANRWRAAKARSSSTAPSSTSSTVTIDTTRGRPPSLGRNLRAGPCSALVRCGRRESAVLLEHSEANPEFAHPPFECKEPPSGTALGISVSDDGSAQPEPHAHPNDLPR